MKTSLLVFCGLLVWATAATAQDKSKGSDAEQYAAELSKLLSEYQRQLSNKIAAEEAAYEAAAKLYDDAFRDNVFASLTLDRTADAQQAERALKARRLTPDKFIEDVNAYAERDFDQVRTVYLMGIDSYKTYLSNLNSLEVDSQKVSALARTLNDLAKPTSLRDRLKDIEAYQESFDKQVHFSDCSMADSLLTINMQKKAAIDARIQALNPQNASTTARKALDQQSEDLAVQISALVARRSNSGGFTAAAGGDGGKCEVK